MDGKSPNAAWRTVIWAAMLAEARGNHLVATQLWQRGLGLNPKGLSSKRFRYLAAISAANSKDAPDRAASLALALGGLREYLDTHSQPFQTTDSFP